MASPRYLIVDTDPAKGLELDKLLSDVGATADRAQDLAQVNELLSRKKYDCVLVDRDVPPEWQGAIKAKSAGQESVPMVFLTGPHGSRPPSAIAISGVDGYVQRHKDSTVRLIEHVERAVRTISEQRLPRPEYPSKVSDSYGGWSRRESFADSRIMVHTQRITAPGPVEDIVRMVDRGDGRHAILLGDCTYPNRMAEIGNLMVGSRIDMYLAESRGPSSVLGHLNDELCNAGQAVDYMTAVTCFIDLPNRLLRYAVAGHHPPLHRRWGATSWRYLPGSGIPLGIRPGESFQELRRELHHGDKILLLSDGIMKINGSGGGFQDEGLRAIDLLPMDAAPSEVIEGILEMVESVTGGATVADEITATLIQV
jgi:CheY-like chemotaxis protein